MGNKPWLKYNIPTPLRVSLHKQSLPTQAKIIRKRQRSLSFLFILLLSLFLTIITPHSFPGSAWERDPRGSASVTITTLQTAQTLNEQGRQQLEQGDAEAALNTWKQAEDAYQKAKDENGVIGSKLNQIQALQALGKYRLAEQLLTQLCETIKTQSDSELKATVYRSLGDVLRIVGKLKESEKILKSSLNIAQSLKADAAVFADQLSLGNTAFAQFKRAQSVNDPQTAEVESKKAADFYRSAIAQATYTQIKLQAQLNLLNLLVETNQQSEAEKIWPQVRDEVSELSPSVFAIASKINLARSLLKLNPKNEAIPSLLTMAIAQAKTLPTRRLESYAVGYLGQFYELNQQEEEGIKITQNALNIAEVNQFFDSVYQWQWQLGRLYNNTGNKTAANATASRASAIASYTEAVKTLEYLRKNLVAINPEGQFSFRDEVEPVYRQLVDLLLQGEPTQTDLNRARQTLEALQLAEIEDFFREACIETKPNQIDNIVDNIDPSTAVIYPIILPNRIEVILKLPVKNLLHAVSYIPENDVETTLQSLRNNLERPDLNRQVKLDLNQVYDWLIKPFAAELDTQIKTLVFVLDGSLRNIPMAALYDGKNYLIQSYAIALAPGLQLLDPKPLLPSRINALIAGATNPPSFQQEKLRSLDNVQAEIEQIAKKIPKNSLLNEERFIKNNFQNQLKSAIYSVVHLATHGKFSSDPEQTFILAADGRINIKDLDNWLRLSQKNNVNTIELLVLSACQTAKGDKRAALGLAGVAARAGARTTVATLWRVDDYASAQLMIQFYQQLLQSPQQSKAEALRQAQLKLLGDSIYKSPCFWAAFILLGNWL
ncbi:MAG TPA: hypothetical protein DDW76_06320 [Cyanobacteria bacterium UBA11369]|nr:hypothetical protein [Cyanobacteria bacterium UBA11371]HBE29806.1 hypothetical protein [Cyanobacteria bacterium UBA11368]HBE48420.1 hypothetical protein [Cyanobacteria bacterium UBA11369]